MRYLTRYFKIKQFLNNDFLSEFTINNKASVFDEDFYLEVCKKRKDMFRNSMKDCLQKELDSFIHTDTYVGLSMHILGNLPTKVTSKIADVRVFLLYIISPEVYQLLNDMSEELEKSNNEIFNALAIRYEEDKSKIPKHWGEIYEISWEEAGIKKAVFDKNNLILTINDNGNKSYLIELKNVLIVCKEGDFEAPALINYCEIFYNEPKLEINILTPFSEFSIEANDLLIENITPIE